MKNLVKFDRRRLVASRVPASMKQLLGLLIVLQFPFVDGVRAQAELVDAFPNLVFERPVAVRNDGVSRLLYVVEQFGKIHSVANSASATETKILLDINDRVVADPNRLEAGLLGLAFHPDYEGNGYLFVYYIADDPPRAVLSRFERSADDPDAADPNSEVVLLELSRQTYRHNGGDVVFGPDGYLYLPLGDGSSGEDQFNNAQDPSTLFGSIVRIDVDRSSGDLNYAIPPDNPFAGNTEGFREEIYAYGLRNPWRISFDRETGELWAGDVGERDWEEINIVSKGENYGWPLAGGLECRREACEPAEYVLPVWSYPHSLTSEVSDRINRCVTGGYVYRGSEIPSLSGEYLYSDCASGILWAIEYDGVNPAVNRVVLETGRFVPGFGEDLDGELYVLQYWNGKVLRLVSSEGTSTEDSELAGSLRLDLAGPNPFHRVTTLEFESDRPGPARLTVYDLLGRQVAVLYDKYLPGRVVERTEFDASALAPGLYICRLDIGGQTQTQRVVRVR